MNRSTVPTRRTAASPADQTARPMPVRRREIGLDLVPKPRRFGFGGVADSLAERRHLRRMHLQHAA
ncbi:hypothetical protein [Agromyces seonyuensis]|uniref:Uncharacterized protein n=1 Tax=Agromyces seonyuensis TaxID=2662446 RepID=A0A6I4NWI7_9MICO|nr:hypothetical protein [Agromyces seonyuensis]MWB98531.1 hypothetical protein [Agromyces seonyuensis]